MSEVTLTAYNVKTKEKGVPIQDATITRTANLPHCWAQRRL